MGIHLQGFIRRCGHEKKHWSVHSKHMRGETKSNPRASVGQRTISNRARPRDNPNEVQTESKRQGKGLIQVTRAGIKHEKTGKARL